MKDKTKLFMKKFNYKLKKILLIKKEQLEKNGLDKIWKIKDKTILIMKKFNYILRKI